MRSPVLLLLLAGAALVARHGSPRWVPGHRRRRRRREAAQVVAGLPAALDLVAASLRAGSGLLAGLSACRNGPGPLAGDIDEILRRVDAAGTLAQSLAMWREQRNQPEVAVTAAALDVAVTVGGRASAALEGLASALRDAAEVRAEVAAQSAQARLSAVVVGAAPVGAVAISALVDPPSAATLVSTPAGRTCLAAGLALMVIAAGWTARILRPA